MTIILTPIQWRFDNTRTRADRSTRRDYLFWRSRPASAAGKPPPRSAGRPARDVWNAYDGDAGNRHAPRPERRRRLASPPSTVFRTRRTRRTKWRLCRERFAREFHHQRAIVSRNKIITIINKTTTWPEAEWGTRDKLPRFRYRVATRIFRKLPQRLLSTWEFWKKTKWVRLIRFLKS